MQATPPGQAAVYLSTQVAKVSMIVRGESLEATMSQYLCERIRGAAQRRSAGADRSDGAAGRGRRICARFGLRNRVECGRATSSGAAPVPVHRRRAEHDAGFRSSASTSTARVHSRRSAGRRRPVAVRNESPRACSRSATCAPGSIKRVAAAVGEGAQVVAALHVYLAQMRNASSPIVARLTETANG